MIGEIREREREQNLDLDDLDDLDDHHLAALTHLPLPAVLYSLLTHSRWWSDYADRKNDDEADEHVADSLLYDRKHLPRTAPAPECVARMRIEEEAAAAAGPSAIHVAPDATAATEEASSRSQQ